MTTAPTPDLLPCPFCGGPVAMEEAYPTRSSMYGERRWWGVICRNTINRGGSCAIQQIPSVSIDAAAERWNHRAPLEARKPLPPMEAIKLGMEAQQACRPHSTGTTNWAFAITRFYERRLVDKSPNLQEPLVDKTENLQGRSAPLIASREGVADGPVRVTRLHLTDEGRAGLTSKATGPLPGIKET